MASATYDYGGTVKLASTVMINTMANSLVGDHRSV